ncbi:TetR/AcrR family transcriptional regulator [Nonomuraea sp. NPDC000554]|uniref:TetR/AcrR family transcriptional regulator n=1 Tax=Nonomuraea sp. NPDC000554 TaxID=3154259 RepID=UPI0033203866
MTETAASARQPGRPRSQEADTAILCAALDLLLERGAAETSIEQVAQRAGVTRATIYRRFADKTALLIQSIEAVHEEDGLAPLEWPDIDRMLDDWAGYLSRPGNRRMLRRLYGAVDDYPELLRTYRDSHGGRRASAERATLARAVADGQFPPEQDVEVLQQVLNGAVLHHLGARPDTENAVEVKTFLSAVLQQTGYRPPADNAKRPRHEGRGRQAGAAAV